jgi:hypothetical protein
VGEDRAVCVGLDTHKAKVAVAVAEPGRSGEVRFRGEIANRPEAVRQLIERLAEKHGQLRVCYGAGPCGYGLQRQITALGYDCTVVAPSLVPRKPGDRVKTNRRDALTLARLLRAGELTAVWVPDPVHERRCATWSGRARPRWRRCAGRASSAPGLPAAPRPGLRRPQGVVARPPALAGRAALRAPRPADRAAGAARRDRRGRTSPRPLGRADPGAGAALVAGAGGRGLAGDARRRLPLGGGAGRRGRRLPPLRHPPPAHGLAGPGPLGAAPAAPRSSAAGSPRPATAGRGGCWSRGRGATASRPG